MPATVRPPPDEPRPAIAAAASPYGLRLRDDSRIPKPQPNRVRPMSRLMRDLSPGTYVVNPDTLAHPRSPLTKALLSRSFGARTANAFRAGVHQLSINLLVDMCCWHAKVGPSGIRRRRRASTTRQGTSSG